ncbi:MAG: diguanylate cyclase, partial [Actinobacteria bacterium]|nr:diguanylate cyclase [Actinomycetota bacterium]
EHRQSGSAGRVGGDELMIVLPDTGSEGAAYLSERLREELVSNPFAISEDNSITLRLSIGAASFPQDATTMAELVEVADDNLYISKQRGGNIITTSRAQREASDEHDGWVAMATALLGAVGSRDHHTRRHSEQVVTHALTLGRALGLPDDSLQTLRLAALVHDVGNIGVPTDVFRKRGALDDQENEAVRKHVDVSTAIIADMPRLRAVLEAVKAHHERPDGLGYPNGLLGDDIPQLAKILAVADTYAALTADRPYRKSMDGEEARAELLRAAGTELDPELVQKFLHTLAAQRAEAATTLK